MKSNSKSETDNSSQDVWMVVLKKAMALPGAKVNRTEFLRRTLEPHFDERIVQLAIERRPAVAGISSSKIEELATSSIKLHRVGVSMKSFALGIPGGFWMAGSIPADLLQFFYHVIVILQKLAYLYGWPEFFEVDEEPDDESLYVITLFIGVMLGAAMAEQTLREVAEKVAAEIAKRLPRKALTKWGFYTTAKQIAKWFGVSLTKQSFSRIVSKIIPVISGLISGAITWLLFNKMCKRMIKHLESLRLHTDRSIATTN